MNVNVKTVRILKELGVPASIKGYGYIKTAVNLAHEDGELIHHITKGLYPAIAKEHNTTALRGERAIRHAVECCFDRCPAEVLESYFGNSISYLKGKVTNSEFIATIVEQIHLEEEINNG